MNATIRSSISVTLLCTLFITACAMTNITSRWKDPSYHGQPRKIMVIGVAKRPALKRIFEDEFVRQLKLRGTDAVASYTLMPDTKQGDHTVIAAQMKEHGADAVLISRLVSKKTETTYIPGHFNERPAYYGSWRDYYAYGSQVTYTPGYTVEDEYALMETNLYNAANDKLIWSAASESMMLGSDHHQITTYIGVMIKNMVDQKLLL